ncbi:MAG: flagellar hook-associated family protein [Bradyrhizobium sp.]|nr:MAG: flagellar hook-associated family protein [Bradyrhizobium sp.]
MATSSVSTLSLGTAMLSSMNRAQNQLTQLTSEASSGQYADLGLQLGDQSGYELSLRDQTEFLNSLTTANNLTVTNLKTAQSALDSIRTTAQSTVSTLTSLTAGSSSAASTLQNTGTNSLQELIGDTNTTANGNYVFGGDNSSVAPMADYFSATTSAAKSAIDSAFQSTFGFLPTDPQASTISASDMQSFLSGPFAALFSGSNWTSNWSSASSTDVASQIAPGQFISTSTDANQPGFQQLAEGYAMLTELGGASLSTGAQQAVITAASSAINQGVTSMTATEAGLGTAQSSVTNATADMSNQLTILQTQLGSLDNVNANQIATQLNSLQTQLETAYQLTDQLQKLSLAQYLPIS